MKGWQGDIFRAPSRPLPAIRWCFYWREFRPCAIR